MPEQNSNHPDGKTFGSKAPEGSPEFGVLTSDIANRQGGKPGEKQLPAPVFSPENG